MKDIFTYVLNLFQSNFSALGLPNADAIVLGSTKEQFVTSPAIIIFIKRGNFLGSDYANGSSIGIPKGKRYTFTAFVKTGIGDSSETEEDIFLGSDLGEGWNEADAAIEADKICDSVLNLIDQKSELSFWFSNDPIQEEIVTSSFTVFRIEGLIIQ